MEQVKQMTHFECVRELQDRWISELTLNSDDFDAIYSRKSLEQVQEELQSYRDISSYVVKSGEWHVPGLGEVHNEAHDQMIFCTNEDDVGCDSPAKKVCNALNATSRAAIAEAKEIIQRRSEQQPIGYALAYKNGKPIMHFGGPNLRATLEEAKEASLLHLGAGEPIAVYAAPPVGEELKQGGYAYCEACQRVGMSNCSDFTHCGQGKCVTCHRNLDDNITDEQFARIKKALEDPQSPQIPNGLSHDEIVQFILNRIKLA